jgi:hypothetical protein
MHEMVAVTLTMRCMAIIYPRADLRPSKLELLAPWLPTRAWHRGPATGEPARVAAYRFDDPAGEVGIETLLIQAGDGPLYQVPLTYRAAALDRGDEWLIGRAEHSVLGPRWIYDGCGDPVYAAALTAIIVTGGGGADLLVDVDGRQEAPPPSMTVRGTGHPGADAPLRAAIARVDDRDPTVVVTDFAELVVHRVLDNARGANVAAFTGLTGLTGRWPGQQTPALLAELGGPS